MREINYQPPEPKGWHKRCQCECCNKLLDVEIGDLVVLEFQSNAFPDGDAMYMCPVCKQWMGVTFPKGVRLLEAACEKKVAP